MWAISTYSADSVPVKPIRLSFKSMNHYIKKKSLLETLRDLHRKLVPKQVQKKIKLLPGWNEALNKHKHLVWKEITAAVSSVGVGSRCSASTVFIPLQPWLHIMSWINIISIDCYSTTHTHTHTPLLEVGCKILILKFFFIQLHYFIVKNACWSEFSNSERRPSASRGNTSHQHSRVRA